MSNDIEQVHKKRQELEEKICHLEAKLAKMKAKLAKLQTEEQHDLIDHLEVSMKEVDERYSNLKDFSDMLVADLKKLLRLN